MLLVVVPEQLLPESRIGLLSFLFEDFHLFGLLFGLVLCHFERGQVLVGPGLFLFDAILGPVEQGFHRLVVVNNVISFSFFLFALTLKNDQID